MLITPTGGMGRGFEHRLLPPYRVVSQPEPEDEESGVLTVSPVSPAEYAYEQEKGGCVPVAADTPTMLEEFRDGREKGDYAKVETFEEIERVRDSEEEEDITWQLPEFRRSESIRLDD